MQDRDELNKRVEELERQVANLQRMPGAGLRGIRRRSTRVFGGLPLYDIALGPDLSRGEMRGHARGVFAVGDMATGVVAAGGLARGVFAFGGLAVGLVSFGGLSLGVLLAIGGLAVGSLSIGGAAAGGAAVGGASAGYYACGGAAFGEYVIDARREDAEAKTFFQELGISAICRGRNAE